MLLSSAAAELGAGAAARSPDTDQTLILSKENLHQRKNKMFSGTS